MENRLKNVRRGKEISLKTLDIIFFISLFFLIGLFLVLSDKLSFSGNIHGAAVVNPPNDISILNIIKIKEIISCSELDLKKEDILLLNDFQNSDTQDICQMELFGKESQVSKTISKDNGICDEYLKINYLLSYPATSIEIKCAQKIELKNYRYINFLVRVTDSHIEIQSGLFDENESAYSKIVSDGSGLKNKNGWYLVKVPLSELYVNPRFSSEKKVFKKDISGYIFKINSPTTGECKTQEKKCTIDLDTVYLSKS